ELRPDLMGLFADEVPSLDVLVTAPGLMEGYEGWSDLAREPGRRLSKARAFEHRNAVVEQFARATDRLPRTLDWERRIVTWIDALVRGSARIRHFARHPVHSRLVS